MEFDEFWQMYPKKYARPKALKSWNKLTLPQRVAIGNALPTHRRLWMLRDEFEFIPYPATWINQERWTDELEMPAAPMSLEARAKVIGISARPGESMEQFEARVRTARAA